MSDSAEAGPDDLTERAEEAIQFLSEEVELRRAESGRPSAIIYDALDRLHASIDRLETLTAQLEAQR